MLYLLLCSFFLHISGIASQLGNLTSYSKDFGPYKVFVTEFFAIKGPKQQDLTIYNLRLDHDKGQNVGTVNITFPAPIMIEQVKLNIYTMKEKNKTSIWRQSINQPCKHFVLKTLFNQMLNTNGDCHVKKGTYIIRVTFEQLTSAFLGPKFFYGSYLSQLISVTKKGNLFNGAAYSDILKK